MKKTHNLTNCCYIWTLWLRCTKTQTGKRAQESSNYAEQTHKQTMHLPKSLWQRDRNKDSRLKCLILSKTGREAPCLLLSQRPEEASSDTQKLSYDYPSHEDDPVKDATSKTPCLAHVSWNIPWIISSSLFLSGNGREGLVPLFDVESWMTVACPAFDKRHAKEGKEQEKRKSG